VLTEGLALSRSIWEMRLGEHLRTRASSRTPYPRSSRAMRIFAPRVTDSWSLLLIMELWLAT